MHYHGVNRNECSLYRHIAVRVYPSYVKDPAMLDSSPEQDQVLNRLAIIISGVSLAESMQGALSLLKDYQALAEMLKTFDTSVGSDA